MSEEDSQARGAEVNATFWALTSMMPDARALLSFVQAPEPEADAFYVLDANVLLQPYEALKELEGISKALRFFVEAEKLVVPGQAIREFFKNRSRIMAELSHRLSAMAAMAPADEGQIKFGNRSAIFEQDQRFVDARRQFEAARKAFADKLKDIKSEIEQMRVEHDQSPIGSDAVTRMYASIIADAIVDPEWSADQKAELVIEYNARAGVRLPPGYKDKGKNGDFLIWKTVLAVAEERRSDCVIVTHEEKADWFVRSQGGTVRLRDEMLAEYHHRSGGRHIYAATLSEFMQRGEAAAEAVASVRLQEAAGRFAIASDRLNRVSAPFELLQRDRARYIGELLALRDMVDKSSPPPVGHPGYDSWVARHDMNVAMRSSDQRRLEAAVADIDRQLEELKPELEAAIGAFTVAQGDLHGQAAVA